MNTGRPVQIVAIQAKTETALRNGDDEARRGEEDSASTGRPVANMWCTQTPKPTTIVATVAIATSV